MAYPVMSTDVPWSLVKSGFKKTPRFNTSTQTPAAGRGRSSISYMPYPGWDFELDLNYLLGGEAMAGSVLQDFLGCYIACSGGGSPFLFTDPNDNAVTDANRSLMLNVTPGAAAPMGNAGDGTSTQFQLARQVGQGTDILQQASPSALFKYDWQGIKNLCLHSENLAVSPWSATGLSGQPAPTLTANAASAPDGAYTGTKIQFNNVGGSTFVNQNVAPSPGNQNIGNRTWTFSVWLRVDRGVSSTGCRLVLQENASPFTTAAVNLPTLTSTWQRYSVTLAVPSSSATLVNGLITNDNTGAIPFAVYAWGAQLEESATVTSYQKTNADNRGPLFQYSGSRQNLLLRSQDFTNAVWTRGGTGSSITTGQSAPDGSTNAQSLISGSTDTFLLQNLTLPNAFYTFSVWLRVTSGTLSTDLTLRNSAQVLTYGQQAITVTTKWKRFTVSGSVTDGTIQCIIGGFASYISSSTTLQLFAAQLENWGPNSPAITPYPWAGLGAGIDGGTAYIPTTTAPVTATTDYSLGANGVVTFATAPASGALLTWIGAFQYLCQFTDDTLKDLARVSKNSIGFLWSCSSIAFESVFV